MKTQLKEKPKPPIVICERCGKYYRQTTDTFRKINGKFTVICRTCESNLKCPTKTFNYKEPEEKSLFEEDVFVEEKPHKIVKKTIPKEIKNISITKGFPFLYHPEPTHLSITYTDKSKFTEESLYSPVETWFKLKGYSHGRTRVAVTNGYIDIVLIHTETHQELLCEVKLSDTFHDIMSAVGQLLWYNYAWKKTRDCDPILYIAATHVLDESKKDFLLQQRINYLPILLQKE